MSTPGNLPQCKILSPNTRDNDGNSFMAELENTTYLMHSVLFMGFCYPKQCVEKDSESKSELSKKRVPSGGGGGGGVQHISSPTRYRTRTPYSGSTES